MKDAEARKIIAFVGTMIRGAREIDGVTMRELAKMSGVSIGTISRVERTKTCDAITFLRLIDWLANRRADGSRRRVRRLRRPSRRS